MSSLFDKVRVLVRSRLTPSRPQKQSTPPDQSIPQDWINAAQKEVGSLYSRADLADARDAEMGVSSQVNTVDLRQMMLNHLSVEDLNAVANIMGIEVEKLEGGKGRRVMGLITLSEKEARLDELSAICQAMKPDLAW